MSCWRERFALGLVRQRISPFLGGKDQQGKQNLVSVEAPLLAFSFQLLKVITWFLFISEGPHPVGLWSLLVEVGPLTHTRLFSGSLVAFLFPSFLQIINSQAAVSTFWSHLLIKVQQSKGLDPGESWIHWNWSRNGSPCQFPFSAQIRPGHPHPHLAGTLAHPAPSHVNLWCPTVGHVRITASMSCS